MGYEARDYSALVGKMEGFGEAILKNHFTLYQGYVANTNKLLEKLAAGPGDGAPTPEFSEMKRRLGWEFNGMRLHELYFENLGGSGAPDGKIVKEIEASFGSFDNWKKEFKAAGMMRGIGWVALYKDPRSGKLINFWINEHDVSHPAGCTPVLIMDVFEHAYLTDYGLKRADYIEAFFKNINWGTVNSRI
ncbi:MAG: superoxide dismutase [Actinomycetota bacterium]|nr:superoxide dismutase [Actinomycetota bacterium]